MLNDWFCYCNITFASFLHMSIVLHRSPASWLQLVSLTFENEIVLKQIKTESICCSCKCNLNNTKIKTTMECNISGKMNKTNQRYLAKEQRETECNRRNVLLTWRLQVVQGALWIAWKLLEESGEGGDACLKIKWYKVEQALIRSAGHRD